MKRELASMSKTCRNFQFKLRRSQIRERQLASENALLKDEIKTTAKRTDDNDRGLLAGCGLGRRMMGVAGGRGGATAAAAAATAVVLTAMLITMRK